ERYGGRHLGKGGAQDVQSLVELLVRNGQRHQRADHVVVHARPQQDQSLLARHHSTRAVSLSAGSLVLRLRTSSMPAIAPITRTSPTISCSFAQLRIRSSTMEPIRAAPSGTRSSRMTSGTARPAPHAPGLPAYVPPRPPG